MSVLSCQPTCCSEPLNRQIFLLRSPIFYLQRALACEILLQIRSTTTAVVVQVRGELTMQGNPCPIVEQYFALMSTFIRTIGFAAVKRIPSRRTFYC